LAEKCAFDLHCRRPTLQALAGDRHAAQRVGFGFDGHDIFRALITNSSSPRTEILHNIDEATGPWGEWTGLSGPHQGAAIRVGRWKLLVNVSNDTWWPVPTTAVDRVATAHACAPGGGHCEWNDAAAAARAHGAEPLSTDSHALVSGLFDIERDPQERLNLFDARPDVVAKLSARIAWWRTQQIPPQNREADPAGLEAANKCGAWVPWQPTFDGCPDVWCEDLHLDCAHRLQARPDDCNDEQSDTFFSCAKTCGRCQ
jgi:hypothetical protein